MEARRPPTFGSRSPAALADRRQQILAAATSLFVRKGMHGTTADEIAEAAGITKRTLYRHMGSKDRILFEIHEQLMEIRYQDLQAVLAKGGTATERLQGLIMVHIDAVAEQQEALTVFFEELKHLDEPDYLRIIARRDEYVNLVEEILREGMATGEFRKVDPTILTRMLLGMLTETYRWYRPAGPKTPAEIGAFVADLMIDGLEA